MTEPTDDVLTVYCANEDCPEYAIAKSAPAEAVAAGILCGGFDAPDFHCGQPVTTEEPGPKPEPKVAA